MIGIRILHAGDETVLERVAADVFDDPLVPDTARLFLADPRHHLVVAVDDDVVVGFASAVHYLHPDKEHPELWINEVGVAETHQRRGLGKAILAGLFDLARSLGCREAWVLTERDNHAAQALYRAAGGEEADEETVMFNIAL
jgi:aminoglycoside 6'-N-acetyltransferase I